MICQEMILQNCFPDSITVDGAEHGTGAAPLAFSDGVGMPFKPAPTFVNKTLIRLDIRDKIRVICSGKIISGYSILRALAIGAYMCKRFYVFIGCIQPLRYNNNTCPIEVATQDKMLIKGLAVKDKSERVSHLHKNTLHAANELLAAPGKSSYNEVDGSIFMRGDEFIYLSALYFSDNSGSVI